MNRKINILGTEYEIIFNVLPEGLPEGADATMDQTLKVILIAKLEPDRNYIKNLDAYRKKVLRHEIIHAFMYESGMWSNSGSAECWGMDETITDWFAIQSPKIYKAFKDADCLE